MALSQTYINYALEMNKKYGSLTSVLLGQFIYESSSGTSNIAKKANNCFGIKGKGTAGSYVSKSGTKWRKYNSKKESFDDYARITTNSRYKKYTKGTRNPKKYLEGLVKGGYCPDKGYVSAVMKIINSNNLTKYDGVSTSSVPKSSVKTSTITTSNVKDIVDIAITQIGIHEQGKNRTKYGAYTGTNGLAWCCAFVAWCAHKAGVSHSIVPKTASCETAKKWYISKGRYHPRGSYKPKRGDQIFFVGSPKTKTETHHTGIVEKVSGGKVYTIEGNSSDKVARRSYSLSSTEIRGYGNPAYKTLNMNSSGVPTTYPSGKSSTTSRNNIQKASAEEIAYLKKILKKNKAKSTAITDMEVVKNFKVPECNVQFVCQHGEQEFELAVLDDASLEWERRGSPGTLKFKAVKSTDKKLLPTEGDRILLTVDGTKMFQGFVFKISRSAKNSYNEYTVYDSLRYLKNKDVMIFSKKRLDQIIKTIASRTGLKCGNLPNTKFKMSAVEDDSEYFDMIQNAIDRTMMSKDQIYVLYDNVGTLQLTNIDKMKVNSCLIDADTGEDYTYETSIDSGVYNQVKLIFENKDKGTYDLYVARDSANISKWGLLQYTEKIQDPSIGKLKAQAYLKLYNMKARHINISGVLGDTKVRAGSMVPVMLKLDDVTIANYMLVEKVTHTFKNREHKMELVLSGGGFTSGQ